MLLSTKVQVQRIPIEDILPDLVEELCRDSCAVGHLSDVPLAKDNVVEERLGHLIGLDLAFVGVNRDDVVDRVEGGIRDGLDDPLLVVRELGSEPVSEPDAGPLPEPIQDTVDVVAPLRRVELHVLAVVLCHLSVLGIGVVDEPLVVDPLDVYA